MIPDGKLRFLIDEVSRTRTSSKVGTFRDLLGYTDHEELRAALLAHLHEHEGRFQRDTEWGARWYVDGRIPPAPSAPPREDGRGRAPWNMRTVWEVSYSTRIPKLVTARPLPRTED